MKNTIISIISFTLLIVTLIYFSACSSDVVLPIHKHTYSEDWFYNDEGHFHKATCGHVVETEHEAHTFDDELCCTVCGYKHVTHVKGDLISICTENHDNIKRSGVFKCSICESEYYDSIEYSDVNMPMINLTGSFMGLDRGDYCTVAFDYCDFSQTVNCYARISTQGASAQMYEKKNYTVKLFKDSDLLERKNIILDSAWGNHDKYCLKANYVDFSQSRNIVSGQLFSEILKSGNESDKVTSLANSGAVDGFPCVLYINNEFYGLYTINIPKEKWMFGMGIGEKEALLFANGWESSTSLKKPISSSNKSFWEIEYCSTEDTTWVYESFNKVYNHLATTTGDEFVDGLYAYIDVDKAIDSMIFTDLICAQDNIAKNIIWATYDGKVWYPSVYDMDASWGLFWNGKIQDKYDTKLSDDSNYLFLWKKMQKYLPDEIEDRYAELRQDLLTKDHIKDLFATFFNKINYLVVDAEKEKWPNVKSHDDNNYEQIVEFVTNRLEFLDSYYNYNQE